MFFLSLDNQLFLILVLVFSSLLFVNTFVLHKQSFGLRAFGLSFALPFFLTIISFLTAPYHNDRAQDLLILSQLFLILICTCVLFTRQESDSLKLFYILPFVLVGAALVIAGTPLSVFWLGVIHAVDLLVIILNLALAVHSLLYKGKKRLTAYLGLFMIASSLGIWLLSGILSAESLLLTGLGYGSCALYVYKNTLSTFFKEYEKNTEAMNRINASIHTEVIRRVEEIERANRKLLELSKTDGLTGLYTKNAILKSLETHLERSPQTALSILMIDIDKFKQINDTMGHQIGDRCIKSLSSLIQGAFRKDDVMGRYGGDEFMILLPGITPVKAYLIADRFRQLVQSKSVPQFSVSVGISSYPEDGKTTTALIEAADKALYASKQKGRNTVTLYSSVKPN